MEQIIAYKPECGCKNKTFRTKSACMAHEKWCVYNVINHGCPTCSHYDRETGCEMDIIEHNEGADFILAGGYLAKHCPYWGYNKEFKR